jgi:hypothetical protein
MKMKKTVLLLAAIAVVCLGGCPTEPEPEKQSPNSDIIGTWYGTGDYSSYRLEIGEGTYAFTGGIYSSSGSWSRQGTIITLSYKSSGDSFQGTATLSGGSLSLIITSGYLRSSTPYIFTKPGASGGDTTLKIKNESFSDLTEVLWQGVSFASNSYEDDLKMGTTVTMNVEAGGGYIFFKRKSNQIIARTQNMVIVESGETVEFTFTDNTLVVEINNPGNIGSLGSLKSTVVFFDNAEGEMQPYNEKQSFVGYYNTTYYPELSGTNASNHIHYSYYSCHTPRNGNKSIAVGGTNTAKLHLRVTLNGAAKLSFWYANKDNPSNTGVCKFSIDDVDKRSWTTDLDWGFIEYDLEAGVHNLVWEKLDGYSSSTDLHYYLSLDDILVVYTE